MLHSEHKKRFGLHKFEYDSYLTSRAPNERVQTHPLLLSFIKQTLSQMVNVCVKTNYTVAASISCNKGNRQQVF